MRKFRGFTRFMSNLTDRWKDWTDPNLKIAEGGAEILAQLLGLLVTFIGANLTLQLVRDIWPRVALSDLDFAKGEEK
jgi:hypothetical protein